VPSSYGGVAQRWVLIYSEQRQPQAQRTVDKQWRKRPCTCWVRINEVDLSDAVCLARTRRSAPLKRESQGLMALALPAHGHTRPPIPPSPYSTRRLQRLRLWPRRHTVE
jgi:hypothetical protein